MKNSLSILLTLFIFGLSMTSCKGPERYWECYPEQHYDEYEDKFYEVEVCGWVYYNDNSELVRSRDLVGDVADKEALKLEKYTEYYSEKFSLSESQAQKIAKNISDFTALKDRSEDDIADFAFKLYGVNPNEVISAISSAQAGEYDKLKSLVDFTAKEFETTPETMREILTELHGQALRGSGIDISKI